MNQSASAHAAFIARVGLEITTEITITYGRRPTMTLLLRMEAGLTPTIPVTYACVVIHAAIFGVIRNNNSWF